MGEFYLSKRAAEKDKDPVKRTAVSLFKIIQFLFYRIPVSKRPEFYRKLKGKLTRLSPGELSIKKAPLSSSVGQSLGIAKNLLTGLDPVFVKRVLVQLTSIITNMGLKDLRK